ncbi:MAG: M20/M25/M40 family metallo-hydrolase [Myxococcales bacterium]|nr:M20/M25/M40 family metallo-hydrolase [Myxococcales bacterium]
MRRRTWAALAVLWFALVALGWGLYARHRLDAADRRAADRARWLAAIRAVEAPPAPPAGPPPDDDLEARLMGHVTALAYERHRPADRARARGYLAHHLQRLGYRPALLAFKEGVNLEVERSGLDAGAGAILVGAHYDTVFASEGADDNASGVAAALELARLLQAPTPRALRVVFFDAEEQDYAGSRAYARSDARVADLRGVVVLDMIGVTCRTPGCQQHPHGLPVRAPDVGDYLALIGDLEHLDLLRAFHAAPVGPRVFALPVPAKGMPLPTTRRSDHAAFWDRGVGAVLVTDTAELRNPRYHLPGDTPDTLDPAFLTGSTRRLVGAVEILLGASPLKPAPPGPRLVSPTPTAEPP